MMKKSKKKSLSIQDETRQLQRRSQSVIIFLLCLAGAIFIWVGLISEDDQSLLDSAGVVKPAVHDTGGGGGGSKPSSSTTGSGGSDDSGTSTTGTTSSGGSSCPSLCSARRQARTASYGGDILQSRDELVKVAKIAKSKLIDQLSIDYGNQTFVDIFVDPLSSNNNRNNNDPDQHRYHGKRPVNATGPSLQRLKRKFKLKVLQAQILLAQQDDQVTGCDCGSVDGGVSGTATSTPVTTSSLPVRYVWATGGHSAAAGHGNMYNESYTAYMERDLKPIFEALGIEFEGRNYAMGGTGSGYEVSMCFEQIFGDDIDFFSWDYGMTDGNAHIRTSHYGYRGAMATATAASSSTLSSTTTLLPPLMALHVGGRSTRGRLNKLQQLEDLGMATFVGLSTDDSELLYKGVPESVGKSDAEIDAMPEYVRNFKCDGGKMESGDPYCGAEKYTKRVCSPRAKQTSWHPGFKMHALDGHSVALFMVQYLFDALNELANDPEQDPHKLLATLQKEEDDLYQNVFLKNPIPPGAEEFYEERDAEDALPLDVNVFFKGPSICRTGRLPAKSRFLGIMTNDDTKTGDVAPFTKETYETGISESQAKMSTSESNEETRLVYTEDARERDKKCTDYVLKPDYKDFYYSHANDGLTKMIFPNEAEKVAYRYDENASANRYQGMLVMFLTACDWGKCQKGDLRETDLGEERVDEEGNAVGGLELFVNGEAVTRLAKVGSGGYLLVGENENNNNGKDGRWSWSTSSNGNYEIGVHAKRANSFVRISAFVLY